MLQMNSESKRIDDKLDDATLFKRIKTPINAISRLVVLS